MTNNQGISIVICCHNSSQRLSTTLAHLAQQHTPSHIPWEIIVVDNASTDNTAQVAQNYLIGRTSTPLRVVCEPQPGLIFARQRGFREAQYEFVNFIDDDNWVASNWVETIYRVMLEHPEAGACGGKSEAVAEVDLPVWLKRHEGKYAIGNQAEASCDVTWTRGYLWGAGLTIRKSAWEFLISNGFSPLLTGRIGGRLAAGDDSEICLALRLAGWKLWYDERLEIQHYLSAARLRWDYLKRLVRGFGASSVLLSVYKMILVKNVNTLRGRTGKIWLWKLRSKLQSLIQLEYDRLLKYTDDDMDLELKRQELIGGVQELLKIRGKLDFYTYEVRNAPWNLVKAQQSGTGK